MENWKTEESVDSLEVQIKDRRSVLLLVICILTWVGCLYTLAMVFLVLSASSMMKIHENISTGLGAWFFIWGILGPILCAFGAFFMFRLKRWGFWIYCLGEIPPIIYSIYSTLAITRSWGGGMFFGILTNLIPIAFIIMYAIEMSKLNKKPVSIDF